MLVRGADIHSVQAVLGHSVPLTTLNIYGHIIADLQVRAVATLDAALEGGFCERKARILTYGYKMATIGGSSSRSQRHTGSSKSP